MASVIRIKRYSYSTPEEKNRRDNKLMLAGLGTSALAAGSRYGLSKHYDLKKAENIMKLVKTSAKDYTGDALLKKSPEELKRSYGNFIDSLGRQKGAEAYKKYKNKLKLKKALGITALAGLGTTALTAANKYRRLSRDRDIYEDF